MSGFGESGVSRPVPGGEEPPPGFRSHMEAFRLPEWSGPTAVLVSALRRVQGDLDAAGLGRYVLSFAVAGGVPGAPLVNVQWRGTWTSDGIDVESEDPVATTVQVAAHTAQGLIELEDIYWPTCPSHAYRVRAAEAGGDAVWNCQNPRGAPHVVATIGELSAAAEGGRSAPLWRTLDQFAGP